MTHCGYEPSGALGTNYQPGDNWKMIKYNFGPRPAPFYEGRKVNAFNGFSIGKGHLAEAKAAINPTLAGAAAASCARSRARGRLRQRDISQRDDLLAKIARQERLKKPIR